MSLPEVLLWQRLKGSPQGIAFRKQHPTGPYRADFYCAAAKRVVEVDGLAHDMGDRPARGEQRTAWLETRGYHVLRVLASDVLRDPDEAATSLIAYAKSSPFTGRGTGVAGGGGAPPTPHQMYTPLHRSSGTVPLPINGEDQVG
ncbi:endonuclease domain-containing protein [Sphingomonas sp.]|uniref:endonuclease domain-containing protein n=1 Tax=Sphingomonas sp. TaxID=28214 RepID=UPI002DE51DFD|nr:endonuclease domain-containing protein [Sphingomonas sp.]